MLKHRKLCHNFHPYITYIKRFTALDTGSITKLTRLPSKHRNTPRTKSFIKNDFKQIPPSNTTALTVPNRTEEHVKKGQLQEGEKFRGKFEGTYHFHRRFFCDSICHEHIVNKFEWVRLSRLLKHPYSTTQRLFIENLFNHHSPTYIRYLFSIWGINMKDIDKFSNNQIKLDHIYVQIMNNNNNNNYNEVMLLLFHRLLYEQQINNKKVIPLNEILNHIHNVYYYNKRFNINERQRIKSDIIKILQSFRQFVVHSYKDREIDLTQKNPVISIWSQIGNILQINKENTLSLHKMSYNLRKLQDVLIENDFYLIICLFYQIFGTKKDFNRISTDINTLSISSVSDEENQLFIPKNVIKGTKTLICDDDIVLRLDSLVINLLNKHELLPKNLPLILKKLQRKDGYDTEIGIDGVWSIYNDVQNRNDLSLIVLTKDVYLRTKNVFKWFETKCFWLKQKQKQGKEIDFAVIGIEGDIDNKRKLWFLLCYLQCDLGNELNVLCWLSSTIKGWEFELNHYKESNGDRRLFELYSTEYRRIIRDILHSNYRCSLIFESGSTLISRLSYIYLNDNIPRQWLNEDWLILAKLCPKIVVDNGDNPLVFLMEILNKLSNNDSNDIFTKLKRLINDVDFVVRLSIRLSGNNECYIGFLSSLCCDDNEFEIVDTNCIHLFMETVLLPSADILSAFNLLKLMIKHNISMNIQTISLFMQICEYSGNSNIMYDVYQKLYKTLGSKISHNDAILKCILRMFLKDNKWIWINEIFENVDESALQKCYIQLIDLKIVIDNKENELINKELINNLLIDVFNQNKYNEAIKKLLQKTFQEYKKYLNKERKNKYIVYKMNVLEDIIAKSTNKELLNKWDHHIMKLRKM